MFSFTQAQICIDNEIHTISFFINNSNISMLNKKLFKTIQKTQNYIINNNSKTIITTTDFKNIKQINNFSGCKKMVICSKLLKNLSINFNYIKNKFFNLKNYYYNNKKKIYNYNNFIKKINKNKFLLMIMLKKIFLISKNKIKLEKIIYKFLKK